MVSIYDVFAEIIEHGPCKPSELKFTKPINHQIKELLSLNYIKKNDNNYVAIKNDETYLIFEVISFCLKTGLDYNLFLSKDIDEIIKILNENLPNLRPNELTGNSNILKLLKNLESNQFILVRNGKPRIGTFLQSKFLNKISQIVVKENFEDFNIIKKKVLNFEKVVINPFEKNYFGSISSSAQLEGSTVTLGETMDIILNDIYPNKKHEEIQMVKNLNEAMKFMLDNLDNKLDLEMIKQINFRVMFSLHSAAGNFKISENKIAGNPEFKTTSPQKVNSELKIFCEYFNSIDSREKCLENLGKVHNDFQRIHPFPDGNSRTTRVILNFLLLRFNFPLFILRPGSFERYMGLTKLAKKRDDTELNNLICHILIHEKITQN